MAYCALCHTYFCSQTHSSPREDCDCGQNVDRDELRREYFASEREPSEDELEDKRQEKRTA